MKNRLPLETQPYQQSYVLLFTKETSKNTFCQIGAAIKALFIGDVFSYEEVESVLNDGDGDRDCSPWDILNSLDHYLTLSWIRAGNDHESVATQDRMYIRC